ncbi:hypothetical protein N7466_007469 [Penicillium verhagenii]|uniref:uncharacterized protein n=1 Tax=Penicillium verhagenii TaxID=1562060 RepID=UPI0025452694|nr:uncharacterized protein N7466_007469 [Penicillium verhagenii]KAJ5928513.1 hypothetical protein N7466_007469 [Penicillium verhagenii]
MQGFNMGRYVPPDQEGLTTGNKLAGKHPLGARARHLNTTGALIVRFEMPFATWCTNCKPHETIIGQGVRFNAEKKKIGNYYSTPIYSFRMKHIPCGGWIEIRTDPQNTAYVVHEGGRKRDTGDDKPLQPGEIAIRAPGLEPDPAEKDPFSKIEGKMEDKRKANTEASRILELQERQNRDWEDPYMLSQKLRRTFRAERKGLEKLESNREALQDKMSLGFDVVDETEEDRQRAGMVDFGDDQAAAGIEATRANRRRPMFEQLTSSDTAKSTKNNKGKSKGSLTRTKTAELAKRKASLREELAGNTRAVIDPFLKDASDDPSSWRTSRKRKKPASLIPGHREGTEPSDTTDSSTKHTSTPTPPSLPENAPKKPSVLPKALLAYGSDSD